MSNICKESPIFDKVLDKKKIKNYFNYFYEKKEIILSKCGKFIIMIYG